jgi:hypothetical protein
MDILDFMQLFQKSGFSMAIILLYFFLTDGTLHSPTVRTAMIQLLNSLWAWVDKKLAPQGSTIPRDFCLFRC